MTCIAISVQTAERGILVIYHITRKFRKDSMTDEEFQLLREFEQDPSILDVISSSISDLRIAFHLMDLGLLRWSYRAGVDFLLTDLGREILEQKEGI
jgi:hypothetical protein